MVNYYDERRRKMKFVAPEVEIIKFTAAEVLTVSGGNGGGSGNTTPDDEL